MDVEVNFLGVVAAMASSLVVGSVWYARAVFGTTWGKLAKVDLSKNNANVAKPIVTTIVVSLITAYVLAHVAYLSNEFFQNSFLQDSVTTASTYAVMRLTTIVVTIGFATFALFFDKSTLASFPQVVPNTARAYHTLPTTNELAIAATTPRKFTSTSIIPLLIDLNYIPIFLQINRFFFHS
jgi:hypothetical protein